MKSIPGFAIIIAFAVLFYAIAPMEMKGQSKPSPKLSAPPIHWQKSDFKVIVVPKTATGVELPPVIPDEHIDLIDKDGWCFAHCKSHNGYWSITFFRAPVISEPGH